LDSERYSCVPVCYRIIHFRIGNRGRPNSYWASSNFYTVIFASFRNSSTSSECNPRHRSQTCQPGSNSVQIFFFSSYIPLDSAHGGVFRCFGLIHIRSLFLLFSDPSLQYPRADTGSGSKWISELACEARALPPRPLTSLPSTLCFHPPACHHPPLGSALSLS